MKASPPIPELNNNNNNASSAFPEKLKHDENTLKTPGKHRHVHKFLISSNFLFDYRSDIKVIRSTMYEPVLDRCVTTTIIEPTRLPVDEFSIDEDSPPPGKPARKHGKPPRRDSHEEPPIGKMRGTENGDATTIDVDQMTKEQNIKNRKLDASVQTLHLVPYRLRFVPGLRCDVKLSPSERNCALKLGCCCRIFGQWALSQVGLTVVVVIWALLGACAFYYTEGERELKQTETVAKIQRDLSVELATDLKQSENHNEVWSRLIHKYFEKHEKLFLEAVGAGFGEGGGGTIWTYPGCVLFAVSLLTTLGFGAPVPRTTSGRGAAVLFAAIGIPLHFLLILNMGNLGAIRLQQLAYRNKCSDVPSAPKPKWLKYFPFLCIFFYYLSGVILFGFVRQRDPVDCFMFPLDFTAAGGVATVEGQTRLFYALYLEIAVTLAATVVSLLQTSASRGIVGLGLKLGLLTNT
ncbi:unnamed protein product [Phyllotreta striolata]|uniref:Potassium channel domain-containing protein n=1 Tax=Phyllotreta striolata TaxID=444603 RepID=A0A9N9XM41_PHYSR|nr:unnamed protein product [Phyllotreta striolata]